MAQSTDWDKGVISPPSNASAPAGPDWDSGTLTPPPPKRSLWAAINDTVIEGANAAAGTASAVANFVRPGNAASQWIDKNIVEAGEAAQSDVVKAEKARYSQEMQDADGMGGEVGATLGYVARNPLLAAAQAAGSFATPGVAIKGATAGARALGLGTKGTTRAGLAAGAGVGAAGAGGDAAGTAYELSREGGATDEQALEAGRSASVLPGLIGAAGGLVGAERLVAGAGGFKGGLVARALKTGAVEGAQEALEEGVTQYEGQRAAVPFNPDLDPMKGVAGAATMGAVLGGMTGAGASVLTPSQHLGIDRANGPLSRVAADAVDSAPAAEPAPEQPQAPLQLAYNPDPMIVFPDGTTGTRAQLDAYIDGLPEDQRIAARARLMGMAPQAADSHLPPEGWQEQYQDQPVRELPPVVNPLADMQQAVREATDYTDAGKVQAVRGELEDAWLALNVGEAQPVAAGQASNEAQAPQDADPADLTTETNARLRAGRVASGVRNAFDGGAPNTLRVIQHVNQGLRTIGEQPLTSPEIARIRRLADARTAFAGLNQRADLPADPAPAVDANADNSAMEALIPERPALQPAMEQGTPADAADPAQRTAAGNADIAGDRVGGEWVAFGPSSGTLGIPRAQMPQVDAAHRGALVNYLKGQGIASEQAEVPANSLKPTQAEFSEAKVRKASKRTGGDRAILVSSDGYVVDGHHQWLAKRQDGQPVKVLQLQAPISQLLPLVGDFPSARTAEGAQATSQGQPSNGPATPLNDESQAAAPDAPQVQTPGSAVPQQEGVADATQTTQAQQVGAQPQAQAAAGAESQGQGALAPALPQGVAQTGGIQEIKALAQQFRERNRQSGADTDRTFAAVLDGFARDVEAGKRTLESVQPALARYKQLAARAIPPQIAEQPTEAAPAAVVAASDNADPAAAQPEQAGGDQAADAAPSQDGNQSQSSLPTATKTEAGGARQVSASTEKTTAQQAQKAQTATKSVAPAARIEDVGEKIGGARKDVWSGFRDDIGAVSDDAIAEHPLSKVWPQPDYQKLIDAGHDAGTVAMVRSLRDAIPSKPRQSFKVRRWAAQVKELRAFALEMLDGQMPHQKLRTELLKAGSRDLRGIAGRAELYEAVGHGQSLEGITFGEHFYTLYKGKPNVTLWAVEQAAKSSSFGNWPRELATGDTKEQALEAFKKLHANQAKQEAKANVPSFDIWSTRRTGEIHVGKKIGRNYAELAGPFKTVREAREYRDQNLDALTTKLEKYKEVPLERADTNRPRVGQDMRQGLDVTPEQFREAFGFRGVEFGNWVEQGRRQQDLNDAFDALMDMAAVLQLPPKAISLNGELGLAFGARGSGGKNPAAAHYERGKVVINLTKKSGAGSLGHEWWHAVDNYFARMRGQADGMLTQASDVSVLSRGPAKTFAPNANVRPEMVQAFAEVIKAINNTSLRARAAVLDARRAKEYWGTDPELSARAFESYLIAKLEDQNASNDYLANVVDEQFWEAQAALGMRLEGSYPYAKAGEVPAIRAAFDHFFNTVETKETDKGVAMFSRTDRPAVSNTTAVQMRRAMVQRTVGSLTQGWGQSPRITVVDSMNDPRVPEAVREADRAQRSQGATGDPEGFWYQDQVYLVASALPTSADATRVLYHEVLGHHGLHGRFGPELDKVLDQVAKLRPKDVAAKASEYGLDMGNPDHVAYAAEEVLAELAQTRPDLGFVQRAIAAIRNFLRSHVPGFKALELTDADIVQGYLLPARGWVERSGQVEGRSKAPGTTDFESISDQIVPSYARSDTGEGPIVRQTDTGTKTDSIQAVIDAAGQSGHAPQKANLGSVSDWLVEASKAAGLDLAGYQHILDGSAVRHIFKQHGNERAERARGQVAITADDLNNLPQVVGAPDRVVLGTSNRLGNDQVAFIKKMEDGSVLYLEEVRTKRKELAAVTARKYPATMSVEAVASTLHPNVLNDGGKSLIVLTNPQGGNSGDARFSRSQPADAIRSSMGSLTPDQERKASWAAPSASQWDDLTYKLQDKHIDTKRVLESIRATGKAIGDDLDVYLQEELYHGRAAKRTEDFVAQELEPLVRYMSSAGLKMPELEEFLHARHAKEANAVIAQRNPDLPDGGSGMTNAEADAVMAAYSPTKRSLLGKAAEKVDAIIAQTRQTFVEYGLESQDTVDAWSQTFAHYVPLMREQDGDGMAGLGTGQGFSVKGKEVKGRTGSTKKVVDILANIAMQRERAIVRGEKNRVAAALVGLAKANPSGFWKVDVVPTRQVLGKDGMVKTEHDPLYKQRDNVVVAKIPEVDAKTGKVVVKEHAVLFDENDARALRMAQALKNLDAAQLEGMLGATAKVTRYLAAINTQYNPIFGVTNLVRDLQGAAVNLQSTELAGRHGEVLAQSLPALRGIYSEMRAQRKGETTGTPWSQLWEEFQGVGGQTGYRDQFRTSADRGEAIEKALDPGSWADSGLGKLFTANGALKVPMEFARKKAQWLFQWLEDYNTAMENGVRLATYKAGLDAGLSKERAASIAKNLTTNFNRKGQVAQQVGALYAFFNASMQGTARIGQAIFTMEPGKPKTMRLSQLGKKVVFGGVTLGVMQALLLAAAGFDEGEPQEFVRERNLIIPVGGKKYITIPMPLGLHVLPNLGRIPAEFAMGGFQNPSATAIKVMSLFADAFNPMGSAGLSMQTLVPTVLDPLAALAENKDFSGRSIAKESFNQATPGHALGRDSASALATWVAQAINFLSGGTQYVRGEFSPTPDQIEYLVGQATGGVGRELLKLQSTAKGLMDGDEVPPHKVPLLGRFYGDSDTPSAKQATFYGHMDSVRRHSEQVKGLRLDGNASEAMAYAASHPEARLAFAARKASQDVQKMRERRREMELQDASKETIRDIDQRMVQRMQLFNELVGRTVGAS